MTVRVQQNPTTTADVCSFQSCTLKPNCVVFVSYNETFNIKKQTILTIPWLEEWHHFRWQCTWQAWTGGRNIEPFEIRQACSCKRVLGRQPELCSSTAGQPGALCQWQAGRTSSIFKVKELEKYFETITQNHTITEYRDKWSETTCSFLLSDKSNFTR